jgi:DNA-binding response OmpR family regulator
MRRASILVTDDESAIRLMLRTALETDGYDVTEAANGREAVDAIATRRPDLMVLDLNMPILDGIAVLEQMKSMAAVARPRVIVLTAYGSIPTAVKATRLGAIDFLEKPITPNELRQTVRDVLDEPEPVYVSDAQIEASNYAKVLQRIRAMFRLADYPNAETLLTQAASCQDKQSAEYFNLLGILYEAQHKWRLARKCYGKALTADEKYEPAKTNMRRLIELQSFGRSSQAIMLGDESDDLWFARLPESRN